MTDTAYTDAQNKLISEQDATISAWLKDRKRKPGTTIRQGLGLMYLGSLAYVGGTGGLPCPDWGFNWATILFVAGLSFASNIIGGQLSLMTLRDRLPTNSRRVQVGYRLTQATIIACMLIPFVTHHPATIYAGFGVAVAAAITLLVWGLRKSNGRRSYSFFASAFGSTSVRNTVSPGPCFNVIITRSSASRTAGISLSYE